MTAPPRNVVLVDFPWTRPKDPRTPLGQASIAAALAAHTGQPARCLAIPINDPTFSNERAYERVRHALEGSSGGTDIAISAYVWSEHTVQYVLRRLRADGFAGRVIVGGPQVTYASPPVERFYPGADVLVRGPGETILPTLLQAEPGAPLPGVAWRGDPTSGGGYATVDLTTLPSPFLTGVVSLAPGAFIRWESRRGCRFKCNFCQHREPSGRLAGPLATRRVFDEVALFSRRRIGDIAVLDPIFNEDDRHSVAILEAFRRHGFGGSLSFQCRFEMLSETFLEASRGLDIRLEFGLQTIHPNEQKAVHRPNNMARVDQAIERLAIAGIPYEVSLIYGLPEQTLDSFHASVAYCLDRGVPVIKAYPLVLLRGTELERSRNAWNLRVEGDPIPRVVASSSFDRADYARMERTAQILEQTEVHHPPIAKVLELAGRRAA